MGSSNGISTILGYCPPAILAPHWEKRGSASAGLRLSMNSRPTADDWLKGRGLRVTRRRLALIAALVEADQPLTLAELQERVPCDFATVFRFISLLEGRGWVRRHYWGDRQIRFELAEDPADPTHLHHHHLVCRICKQTEDIDSCAVHELESRLESESGYRQISHILEFFGVCPACQKTGTASCAST
jgi:Fur family transcriptional regulator, ferric uptake regulator